MSGDVFSKFAQALSDTDPSDPIEPVKLPGDELAHDQPIEWWYFTGHLNEQGGASREFAFEMTAVRLGFDRVEILDYAYFAFIEVSGKRYLSADRSSGAAYSACPFTKSARTFGKRSGSRILPVFTSKAR